MRRVLLLASVVVLAATACVDRVYAIRKSTPGGGLTLAQVGTALAADPSLAVTLSEDGDVLSCRRNGITAGVRIDGTPPRLTVSVLDSGNPRTGERIVWRERIDHICGRLDAAFPQLGPWTAEDNLDDSSWGLLIALAVGGILVAAGILLIGAWIGRAALRGSPVSGTPRGT